MNYKDRYGNLFDGYGKEPKSKVYSHLLDETRDKIQKTNRYGNLMDDYMSNSLISCKISWIKEKIKSAVKMNTLESRKTADEIRNNFFDTIKDNLKDKSFALYEKDDGTAAVFVFDDLVEYQSWISKNPDTLRTTSFGELFKQYGDRFTNVDNYRVTDDILIIMLKDPSDDVSSET